MYKLELSPDKENRLDTCYTWWQRFIEVHEETPLWQRLPTSKSPYLSPSEVSAYDAERRMVINYYLSHWGGKKEGPHYLTFRTEADAAKFVWDWSNEV